MHPSPSFAHCLLARWTWRMAWRDSRRSRGRLLLYSTSILLGVAALVAIGSFGENLQDSVEAQARTLLGADLAILSNTAFTKEESGFLASLGGSQAREVSFSSMVYFPKTDSTRLAQVRAISGGFPFYGALETTPKSAASEFRSGSRALVEESLLQQFGVGVGDTIKIGESLFRISGSLRKVPGEVAAFSAFAPRVYVALSDLQNTGLLQKGSLVRHRAYFQFGPEVKVAPLVKSIRPQLERFHLEVDTVEHRKRQLGRAMTNLYHFLNLVGFIALLLGGIGIASAVHVHIKQKLSTVAILRSLGCSSSQVFAVYLLQGLGLGVIGVTAGIGLGIGIQRGLPTVLAEFVPFALSASTSWPALARAAGVGLAISLLFTLLPLLVVRRIPPLAVLRSSVEEQGTGRSDPWVWACYGLLAASLVTFSISQSQRWTFGLAFAGALGLAFGLLAGLGKLIVFGLKRQIPSVESFTWRLGLSSLHRPNNRTALLILSLGLGTFLILTLFLVQTNLLREILPAGQVDRPDAVLFDIQSDQKEALIGLLEKQHLPVLQDVPVVTMRLAEINGRQVEELRKDPQHSIPTWALRREYRSTYRRTLIDSEKLNSGQWHASVDPGASPVPVSVEDGLAKSLGVRLGDSLVFDVQGVPVKTIVASLREVDWRRLQPNFFFVFPRGVLEEAPSFHILVTHVGSSERSAQMQREVVKQFPNVSTIDLTMVLQTVDSILRKISFVIRFMALFTVGTGLVVLVASVLTGRYQRLQDSTLLRTLGASRRQIFSMLLVEYFCLGSVAAVTGVLLAIACTWGLAAWVFKIHFSLSVLPLIVAVAMVSSLTVVAGLLSSRGVCNHPPLEILRRET